MVPVRPHAYVGAALVALGALLGVATASGVTRVQADLHLLAFHGGFTLLAQAVAFWYLPSFTKREVAFDGLAAYAGPILFPLALGAAALGQAPARGTFVAIALGSFALVLLSTPVVGKVWRGGTPFWRAEGQHRAGDFAAMMVLASAALWLAGAGVAALVRPRAMVVAWPAGLALFALGALAHLIPRLRGAPSMAAVVVAGAFAAQVGALLAIFPLPPQFYAKFVTAPLFGGILLAGAGLLPPSSRKRPGPRWRDAAPLFHASWLTGASGIAFLVFGQNGLAALAHAGSYLLLAAIGLALGALTLLALPVVFNQTPQHAFVWPAALLTAAGGLTLALGFLGRLPLVMGAALLGAGALAWLGALAPLRSPRRDCAVDFEGPPS